MNTKVAPNTSADQRTAEWFEQRKGKITASRVASILATPGAFGNRDSVMREMIRETLGLEREFKGNIATRWGTEHEPDAIAAYEANTGRIVEEISFVQHPEYDFLGASPDGLVGEAGSIEAKCPYSQKLQPLKEALHYLDQVQLMLTCTGREWCSFFIWTPNETYHELVYSDPLWLSKALPKLQKFHKEYLEIMSDPKLQEPFKEDKNEVLHEDFEWLETASQYLDLDGQIKDLTTQRDALKNQLVDIAKPTKRTNKGGGLTVYLTKRKGAIDYGKVPELEDIDLEPYRKKGSSSWAVKAV